MLAAVLVAACAALHVSRTAAAGSSGPFLHGQLPFASRGSAASARPDLENAAAQPLTEYDFCAAGYPLQSEYSPAVDNGELVLVQVIMRHGDRTPLSPHTYQDVTWDCDGDNQFSFLTSNITEIQPDRAIVSRELVTIPIDGPYTSGTWSGSCDVGQLTPRGAAYQREIGRELRKIYVDRLQYLPKTYSPNSGIYVRSSATGRTKQSASRFVSGLYPNEYRPNDSILNIVSVPFNVEYMTRNYEQCPQQVKLLKKMLNSKPFKRHLDKHKPLWKKLRSVFGEPRKSEWPKRSFLAYVDYLAPRRCHLLPLPCNKHRGVCLTDDDVDAVLRNANWEIEYFFKNSKRAQGLTRVTTGAFLAELRDSLFRHAKAASERDRARSLYGAGKGNDEGDDDLGESSFEVYSVHEETIASLLGAFQAKDTRLPPYSSNIVVELWRTPAGFGIAGRYDDFFVRIFYNGKVLKVPWCDLNACEVEMMWIYTKDLIPEDINGECKIERQDDRDDEGVEDPDVGGDLSGFHI